MLVRLKTWYKSLTPLKQLGIIFLASWVEWFIASLSKNIVFDDEKHTLTYHIFDAVWMALFQTILFNWDKVKAISKRKGSNTTQTAATINHRQ